MWRKTRNLHEIIEKNVLETATDSGSDHLFQYYKKALEQDTGGDIFGTVCLKGSDKVECNEVHFFTERRFHRLTAK